MWGGCLNKRVKKPQLLGRLVHMRGLRALVVILWVLAGFMLAQIVGVSVFQLVAPLFTNGMSPNAVVLTTILSALVYLFALVLVVGVMWWLRGWTVRQLRDRLGLKRSIQWKDLGTAIIGYVPYILVSIAITVMVTLFVPGFDVAEQQELGFDSLQGSLEFVLAFIALVVLAPIAEELLFRGYLFGTLRRMIAFWPSTIIVSALFGLVHGQWNVALDTFALSIILCFMREHTKSVWAPILLHMLKNGVAFSLLFVV